MATQQSECMLYNQNVQLYSAGVALAVNDFSAAVMTSSANDDTSTKELKGFVNLHCEWYLIFAMAIVGQVKFTRTAAKL